MRTDRRIDMTDLISAFRNFDDARLKVTSPFTRKLHAVTNTESAKVNKLKKNN